MWLWQVEAAKVHIARRPPRAMGEAPGKPPTTSQYTPLDVLYGVSEAVVPYLGAVCDLGIGWGRLKGCGPLASALRKIALSALNSS
jgi:hypothetical protein